jgi:hypothetical protein
VNWVYSGERIGAKFSIDWKNVLFQKPSQKEEVRVKNLSSKAFQSKEVKADRVAD